MKTNKNKLSIQQIKSMNKYLILNSKNKQISLNLWIFLINCYMCKPSKQQNYNPTINHNQVR